jgi:hypothetical protein
MSQCLPLASTGHQHAAINTGTAGPLGLGEQHPLGPVHCRNLAASSSVSQGSHRPGWQNHPHADPGGHWQFKAYCCTTSEASRNPGEGISKSCGVAGVHRQGLQVGMIVAVGLHSRMHAHAASKAVLPSCLPYAVPKMA